MDSKRLFSRFLAANPDRLHVAAHSHHYWPDVAREAQVRCFDEAARAVDGKWESIFGELLPAVTGHIARILNLSDPRRICVATNTHEFVLRILSCLPNDRPIRILTTDGEYHSFRRQIMRLEEEGRVDVTWFPVEPFATFEERFAAAAGEGGHDLVFFSQVFFNSGFAISDVAPLVDAVKDPKTFVVVDGYHGFCAIPTDLSAIESRAFYLGGAYKYAMCGEGCCFLHVPDGYGLRPINTGWMAAIGKIAERQDNPLVPYAEDGYRFFGATFDPSGLYRFDAVMSLLRDEGFDVARVHAHVVTLQTRFLDRLDALDHAELSTDRLVPTIGMNRGRFLTFRTDRAREVHDALAARNVVTDYRADRFRIGFGLYHDEADVEELLRRLAEARG